MTSSKRSGSADSKRKKQLVYGIVNDNIIFIEEHRALALAALQDAVHASVTWAEAMSYLPTDFQKEVRDRLPEDAEPPADNAPFNPGILAFYGDEWPFPNQDMLDFLPRSVLDLGTVDETVLSGPRVDIPSHAKDPALALLANRGWMTTRNDVLVARAVEIA